MNKQMINEPQLLIDKGLGHAKFRRQARESFLKEIGADAMDERQIDQTVSKYGDFNDGSAQTGMLKRIHGEVPICG